MEYILHLIKQYKYIQGADLDAEDQDGETALFCARDRGYPHIEVHSLHILNSVYCLYHDV